MQEHVKPMIGYWRKSLLDGAPVAGAVKASELQSYWQLSNEIFADSQLPDELLERWQKHLEKGKKTAGDIALIPYVYQKRALHGQASSAGEPNFVLPLYLPCAATKEGEITPQDKCLPIIPRELLEPLDDFDGLVIGAMDNFSNAIDTLQVASPAEDEESALLALLKAGEQILDKTAPDIDKVMEEKGYIRLEMCLLLPDFQTSMAGKIIALCDCILRNLSSKNVEEMPLLRTLSTGATKERPLPELRASFSKRVGYPNREHSLADNQRRAAACLLETRDGEVLAVNGPPGTGKTAVLLSLIATEYIQAVLRGDDTPPVIFAASTNNQAVTNILDDFAKIPADEGLFKRWIPWVKSFGSYYPSAYKKSEAESAGRHTDLFFEEARGASQRAIALEEYSKACLDFLGEPIPLEQAPVRIKSALQQEHGKLVQFEKKFAELEAISEKLGGVVKRMPQETAKTAYVGIESAFAYGKKHTKNEASLKNGSPGLYAASGLALKSGCGTSMTNIGPKHSARHSPIPASVNFLMMRTNFVFSCATTWKQLMNAEIWRESGPAGKNLRNSASLRQIDFLTPASAAECSG